MVSTGTAGVERGSLRPCQKQRGDSDREHQEAGITSWFFCREPTSFFIRHTEGDHNMTLLIIGADNIKAFVPKLNGIGVAKNIHWRGRNVHEARNTISLRTDMVLF